MGKKMGLNTKAVAAREHQQQLAEAKAIELEKAKEMSLAAEWNIGSKKTPKHEMEKMKKDEKKKEKEQLEQLVASETASIGSVRSGKPQQADRTEQQGAINGSSMVTRSSDLGKPHVPIESFAASDVDGALQLLGALESSTTQPKAQLIDRHPERRVAAAYRVFSDIRMKSLQQENPSLRYSQLKELLDREWKKSPKNPLNQERVIAYNATQQHIESHISQQRESTLEQFREK